MLKNMRLQTKFFLFYSLVLTVIISAVLVTFYWYLSGALEQRALENQMQLTDKTAAQVDGMLGDLDKIALYIVANPTINDVFLNIKQNKSHANYFENGLADNAKITDTLMSISIPVGSSGIRTSLYNGNGDYISTGIPDSTAVIKRKTASPDYAGWYNHLFTSPEQRLILPPHEDFWSHDPEKIISVLREIKNINNYAMYGIVEAQQPYHNLESLVKQKDSLNIQTYLLTGSGAVVFPLHLNSGRIPEFYFHKIMDWKTGSMKLANPVTHKTEIITFNRSPFSGWILIMVMTQSRLLAPLKFIGNIFVLTGAGILGLTFVVIFMISNQLTKPLKQLINSTKTITLNNLSLATAHPDSSDEVLQLNEAFDSMLARLKESMNELLQIRAQEMKAHLIALQSQMDPHFLYNMLSIISAAGRESGAPKIVAICKHLSNILRYITSYQEDSVPIRCELDHAVNYLQLMKLRFENQFEYEIVGAARMAELEIKIPKLSLEPLVENCFQHGFAKVQPPWRLKISAGCADQKWFITVYDNGIGFPEATIEDLLQQAEVFITDPSGNIKNLKLGGMGLINTLVRLKLLYKEDLIFAIRNPADGGTEITIGGPI